MGSKIRVQAPTGQLQLEFLLARSMGHHTVIVWQELSSGCFWDQHQMRRTPISRAGSSRLPHPSAARNQDTARPGCALRPRLRRDGALRLPSSRVCSRSLTAPVGRPREGEELRRCCRPNQKSRHQPPTVVSFQTCRRLLEVPPPPPSPLPPRPPRRVPVRLNRLEAGGACASREGAGLGPEPFFAASASSRTWIPQEVGAPRFAGRAGKSKAVVAAWFFRTTKPVWAPTLGAKAQGPFLET